ncbi:MAG: hypothetical protein KDC44_22790, partial [Phaeodactylibacter sp.]|nr:hypothetical protein [Phaeodactylibacter sp.]
MENLAVIDLGTNTFHLLVVRPTEEGGFEELYRERKFIKLAENGIATIGPGPFQRGLQALKEFRIILDQLQVRRVRAFGTAGLRTASNGPAFIQAVAEQTGIEVQLISGDEEARLIHLGVAQAVPFSSAKVLIMDIGGGSVEFIIADQDQVYWAQSFKVGVAVLKNDFHEEEPMSGSEIAAVEAHLEETLRPLIDALAVHPVDILIGASGTFDVLENMVVEEKIDPLHSQLPVDKFPAFYEAIIQKNVAERLQMKGMPASRVDMIPVAVVLLKKVIVT